MRGRVSAAVRAAVTVQCVMHDVPRVNAIGKHADRVRSMADVVVAEERTARMVVVLVAMSTVRAAASVFFEVLVEIAHWQRCRSIGRAAPNPARSAPGSTRPMPYLRRSCATCAARALLAPLVRYSRRIPSLAIATSGCSEDIPIAL